VNLDPTTLERYRLKLRYKVSYHLGSSCPDVEDVVQETMVRFLQALRCEKMRSPDSTAAFLSGICNNVIHEYRRRNRKEPPVQSSQAEIERPSFPGADIVELREVINMVMSRLPAKEYEILRAFFLEERSKSDICRSLGLTDIQFRVALFRAKETFREIYRNSLKRNAAKRH
jgi:RNA polymerase sigma-70 factor (ECF subfamily)